MAEVVPMLLYRNRSGRLKTPPGGCPVKAQHPGRVKGAPQGFSQGALVQPRCQLQLGFAQPRLQRTHVLA